MLKDVYSESATRRLFGHRTDGGAVINPEDPEDMRERALVKNLLADNPKLRPYEIKEIPPNIDQALMQEVMLEETVSELSSLLDSPAPE